MNPCFKRTISIVLVSLFVGISSFAQQLVPNESPVVPNADRCGSDAIHQRLLNSDPAYAQKQLEYENFVLNYANSANKVTPSQYTVPVVVHVMETGNSLTAITDDQIREAILQLNERYRKVPGSLGDGAGVDVELEFALAVRDPLGNCTDGIVRVDMTGNSTYMASGVFRNSAGISDAALKSISVWNQTQYYNIWIVSEIDNNNGGAGIQGYAYFATSHGTALDGAVILVSNFKDATSTTGVHELGHAFNLYHTFEGDANGTTCPTNSNCNTQGDRVCDTPPHIRSPYNCTIGTNACTGTSEAFHKHNYMDYSSDACQSEFTSGQKVRVIAAMTTIRSSFLASNGNMSLVPPSAPTVAFEATNSFVCSGNSVQFNDLSSCIPNTYMDTTAWPGITFNWTFTNGVNTYTSNLQNPIMTFPVSGVYDVTLAITTGFGTNTLTQTGYVVVGASPIAACTPGTTNANNFAQTVNNVSFNTINNATSSITNVAYTDFSCTANTVVLEGTTHPISVDIRAGGSAAEVVEVYIDYNNNGVFAAGELVLSGTTGGTNTTATITGNVVIPTNAVENTLLRMRVMGEAGSLTNNERNCVTNTFIGDFEDYGVYIMTACVTPVISVTGSSNPTSCVSANGTVTINGSGSGNVTWTGPTSGSATGVSLPYIITGLTNGTYSIQYGLGGCISVPVNATLTAPGQPTTPTISASGSTTLCAGGSVTLTSSYATGNVWSTGATTQSIVVSTSQAVTVTHTNGGGCSATSATTNVVVNALPAAPTVTPAGPVLICPGGSVDLTSSQASGNLWSTTETTQTITITAAGSYSVQYTDGNGCQSVASNVVVATLSSAGAVLPISEGFVGATFPPTNWNVQDGGTQGITWERDGSNGNAPTAGNSAFVDNFNTNTAGDQEALFVQPMDLSSYTSAQLTFDVAYARYDATFFDQLAVLVSVDCGQNFDVVYNKSGSTLATDPDQTAAYTPTTWRNETIDLSAYVGNSRADVVFVNVSGYGQFLYVDNINITGVGGCVNPTVPTVTATPAFVCTGGTSTLNITGTLNDATVWSIYTGSCGGTLVGTTATSSFVVSPTGPSTTYYVRGTGGCVSPGTCASVTVNVTPTQNAGFSYGAPSYCTNGSNPTPTITGVTGGTFTRSPAGLSINASTGAINLGASTPGTYTVTYTTAGPCPGTSNVSITINAAPTAPTISASGSTTFCAGGSVTLTSSQATGNLWSTGATTQSIVVSTAGSYTVTFTNGSGCSATSAATTVTVNANPTAPTISASGSTTFCAGGSVTLTSSQATGNVWSTGATTQSIVVSTAGSYTVTFTNGSGCSATSAATTVTVNANPTAPTISASGSTTFCAGGSVTLTSSQVTGNVWSTGATTQSIVVSAAGSYTVTFTNGSGCSATSAATTVTVNANPTAPTISASGPTTFCAGGSVTLTSSQATGNVWSTGATTQSIGVSTAGSYTVTFTNGSGCSATSAATTVTLLSPTSGSESATACGSYTWAANGTTYNASGAYTATLTNAAGCDSTATLNLTISTFASGTDVITACDSYLWIDGTTYSASNNTAIFTYVGGSVNGCDSIVTLNLTINNSTSSSQSVSACNNYTWSANGTTYNASGVYTATLTNAAGCDSVATLNLTISTFASGTDVITACDSYLWIDGTTYSASNNTATFTYVGGSVNGCDSIVTLNLTINNSTSGSESVAACNNYMWSANGTTYTASGVYTATLTNAAGCDSVATLNLTISTFASGTDVITACDSYLWVDGTTYSASNNTATFTYVGGSVNGCDSIVTLNLTINNSTSGSESVAACNNYTWSANGTTYTASGVYTATLTNAAGCDSVATLNLTISTFASGTDVITACDSYLWIDGTTYSASNSTATHTLVGGSVNGCDSIVTLNLTINNSTSGSESVAACNNYTWSANGTTYNSSGVYTATLTNAAGCDSVATLNLTINTATSGSENVTACNNYTWSANGTTYTASGVYTATLTNAAGCDSVATLNLTISTFESGTDVITACDSYLWIDGTTYSASNNTATYAYVGGSVNGCDSIVTLNLTINNSTSGSETAANCGSYTWTANGTTYSLTGLYTAVLTNNVGCDSTITLDLTIYPTPTVALDSIGTFCEDASDFTLSGGTPAGGTYSGAGVTGGMFSPSSAGVGTHTVSYVYTNSDGCSGTATMEVVVQDCASLDDLIGTTVLVYPNPAYGTVNIESNGNAIESISIYDATGRLIDTYIISNSTAIVDVSEYATGMYNLQIQIGDQYVWNRILKK